MVESEDLFELHEEKELRKYRKKIRQIENLKHLNRPLNEEEKNKISLQDSYRDLISQIIMKRKKEEQQPQTPSATPTKRPHLQPPEENQPSTVMEDPKTPTLSLPEKQTKHLQNTTENQQILTEDPKPSTSSSPEKQIEISQELISEVEISHPQNVKIKVKKKKNWLSRDFYVRDYSGHEDLITKCAVDSRNKLLITCSRDTTLLVWSLTSDDLLTSLRGHKDAVTDVSVISERHGDVISGSLDCTIKLWTYKGECIKSVYTYNPVTSLLYFNNTAVTGTPGGKIEFFQLSAENVYAGNSKNIDDYVTCMDYHENIFCTGTSGGNVFVWRFDRDLRCLFRPENVNPTPPSRQIYTIKFIDKNTIIYGDAGCNLKILNWANGTLAKLSNHVSDIGMTDSIAIHKDILLASSYDLDSGVGIINIFQKHENEFRYLSSLSDDDTSRILSVDVLKEDENLIFATVGSEIKVWSSNIQDNEGSTKVRCNKLSIRSNVVDSASSGDEDDDEEPGIVNRVEESPSESKSWCSIS